MHYVDNFKSSYAVVVRHKHQLLPAPQLSAIEFLGGTVSYQLSVSQKKRREGKGLCHAKGFPDSYEINTLKIRREDKAYYPFLPAILVWYSLRAI